MIGLLRNIWNDRRGNAIIIAGAALPLVVGAAGLATDTIQWALWKRELQRSADSAAFAGVYALAQSASVPSAVATDLNTNNQTGIALRSGYPQIAYPTSTAYSNGVKVTLSVQKSLGFSSLFMSGAPIITATATAAMVDDGEFCAGALKKSGGAAITLAGSSSVNLGCNAISNANANPAVETNGAAYNFIAPMVAGVGSLPPAINGVASLEPHHMALPDPFAGKYSTAIPAGMTCNKTVNSSTISPGCYKSFKFTGNGSTVLSPGVYYLNSTDFDAQGGGSITGTDVTIILTGNSPGSLKLNGNTTIKLSAPTAAPYDRMLFIQSSAATADNINKVNGTDTSSFDGAMYFPNGNITFQGNAGSMTKCAMVMAYTIAFSGNTNLQNNTSGCKANKTVKGKEVRLVA